MYKPTYCCNCGEKIERLDWNIFTNRRFCALCETEFKFEDILKKIGMFFLAVLGVFGVGSYLSGEGKKAKLEISEVSISKPGVKVANEKPSPQMQTEQQKTSSEIEKKSAIEGSKPEKAEPVAPRQSKAKEPPRLGGSQAHLQKKAEEPVYFCGAATKKGTPCSRKVKGGGRCWQHLGREAILSEKELLIKEH